MNKNFEQIYNIQINTDVGTFILIPEKDTTINVVRESKYFIFSKNSTIEATCKKHFTIEGDIKERIFIPHEMEK